MKEAQRILFDSLPEFKLADGSIYEIPFDGSISLLAMGDIGLIKWRLAKMDFLNKVKNRPGRINLMEENEKK